VTSAVTVHHLEEGRADAPAIVLSCSLGSTLRMWDAQASALAERFRVIRYDHRGHGDSPVPLGPYDLAGLAGDVLGLLDRLGVESAHVCGASLGGQVAMWLAAHEPGRVGSVVLCGTSAWFGPPDPWMERAATVRAQGTEAVSAAVVARWFTPLFAERTPSLVERMRSMIASTPREGYAACCEVVGRTDLRPDLAAIRAPTLVIAGAEDPAVSSEMVETLAKGIAGSRVEVLDPAAHLVSVERAAEVTRLIQEHVNGVVEEETS
jgi:3-oxoadipate enol-lactonase